MQFSNPIVAGTSLVRSAIKSPLYTPGVDGWSVNRDGTAEFLSLIARGSVVIAGVPGIWIGPRDDPDFPAELFAASVNYKGAVVFYSTATEYQYAAIRSVGAGGSMEFGHVEAGTVYVAYQIKLSVGVFPELAGITNFAENRFVNDAVVNFTGDADLQFSDRSAGRGLKDDVFSGVSGVAIGAEAVDQTTTATFDWQEGRAYEVKFGGRLLGSVANTCLVNIRRTNLAGALLRQFRFQADVASLDAQASCYIARAAGAGDLLNTPLALTMTASAGTVQRIGAASSPRFIKVFDVGTDTDYPDAASI